MCGGWKEQEPRSQLTGALVLALVPTSYMTGVNLLVSSFPSFLLCKMRSEVKGGGLEAPSSGLLCALPTAIIFFMKVKLDFHKLSSVCDIVRGSNLT